MDPLHLLRDLVSRGIGLSSAGAGDIGVHRPADAPAGPILPPDLRAALAEHKPTIVALLQAATVRATWRIPDDQNINPTLGAILVWLALERTSFGPADYHMWLGGKSRHSDAGAPSYVADILATEEVARAKLDASASDMAARAAA